MGKHQPQSNSDRNGNIFRQKPWLLIPGMLMWIFFGLGYWANNVVAEGDASKKIFSMTASTAASVFFICGAVLFGISMTLAVGLYLRRARRTAKVQQFIRKEGIPSRARVLKLLETGARSNRNPWVELELEIKKADGSDYRVTTKVLISTLAVPRVQPDCEIDVQIHPDDPQQIAIDESLTR